MARSPAKSSFSLLNPEILEATANRIDAKVFNGEFGSTLVKFGSLTTAHGVPRACTAEYKRGRLFWSLITILCTISFAYQFTFLYSKYNKKEKIVSVKLVFDTAPFPAITVCNLNPFKKHLVQTIPEISNTLDAFHQAVTYSKDANSFINQRVRRGLFSSNDDYQFVQYEPVLSACECTADNKDECIHLNSIPLSNSSACVCIFDKQDKSAWPCYNFTIWLSESCPECNDLGYCNLPGTTNGTDLADCLCLMGAQDLNYCLLKPSRMRRMWEISGKKVPDINSPYRQDFLAQLAELGYANMTDEVAITIKTKENLILTMAGLPRQRRIALSYGKAEFLRMCSFNGQQCDIVNDFKLHVDSAFGNCYTFNANRAKPMVNSRAGPSYGLRLMVFINASDYLPTTEASGVRIAIHERDEFPFPDTFGYSAPTGFVSSFGLSLRKVNRLSVPYAECVPNEAPLPDSYIFRDYKYESEGCTKSCYQQMIVKECGCSDPRFPAVNGTKYCNSLREAQKNCLLRQGERFSRDFRCKCTHPCAQEVYTTTYSAAKWPSGSFQVGDCDKGAQECLAYYGQNAAMIEVYYEQMSFEVLTESEAYMMVNLISDCGGQLGLWMGFSVITMVEVIVLIFDLVTLYCRRREIVKHEKALNKRNGLSDGKFAESIDKQQPLLQTEIEYKNSHYYTKLLDGNGTSP